MAKIGTKSGVLYHYCNVQTGEGIDLRNRENIPVNFVENPELFAGRIFHIGDDGKATLGVSEYGNSPLYVAHRGVEAMDINPNAPHDITAGLHAVQVIGSNMNQSTISSIPLVAGYKIDTSEFDDYETDYTINSRVYGTADGLWTVNASEGLVAVGYVASEHPGEGADSSGDEITRRGDINILTVRVQNIDYNL